MSLSKIENGTTLRDIFQTGYAEIGYILPEVSLKQASQSLYFNIKKFRPQNNIKMLDILLLII